MKEEKKMYVVGIGASAGGLDAIQQLFENMPIDTGMTFVIIQHLSPNHKSLMPKLLANYTKMQIFTVEDSQIIKPNCIYLNRRNKNLHIKGNKLYLLDKDPKQKINLPIDIFFFSLGEEYKESSAGIILSGTGLDGASGIKTIKEEGGLIIVQEPSTAQFDGMPNSAIATHSVDYILPPKAISGALLKHTNKRLVLSNKVNTETSDSLFSSILEEVFKSSGIDFSLYKKNTLLRRLEKRMNINNIDILADYLKFIRGNDEEIQTLKLDFLIGVTSFFRDIEAFNSLNNIISELCKNKNDMNPIRIWIPACSSGEEVYSIAILFDSYIRSNNLDFDFKIFATDIDTRAINAAGQGRFNTSIANDIESQYLENYFVKTSDKIKIIKRIREKIVFSTHNILKDPPFIRMDLISCRNMLIYFENKAQNRVMTNFQFSLNKYGYLFLGNSESIGVVSKLFKTIDAKWKIFQNISDTKLIPSVGKLKNELKTIANKSIDNHIDMNKSYFKANPETTFHKYLSKKHSPDTIFIDKDFDILFIKGDAGKRLLHSEGVFQRNLLKMIKPEIASIIRSSLKRLEESKKDITVKNIVNKKDGEVFIFDLNFHKPNKNSDLSNIYLIQFSENRKVGADEILCIDNLQTDKILKQRCEDLENELKITKEELQNVVEELKATNEELQASNEELMASNEELQSSNEELQSVNEELHIVNSEMQEKNEELKLFNDDVSNLLDNTEIGTLFLDKNLHIRKFTPALKKLFNLQKNDEGRPISSFASNFDEKTRVSIIDNCKMSLNNLDVIENEVNDIDGNPYLQRISPFITSSKTIDGLVINFVDISKIKKVEAELSETENRYQKLFEHLNEGFVHSKIITDKEGVPIDWECISINPTFEKQTGLKAESIVGKRILKMLPGAKNDNIKRLDIYAETALTGKEQTIEVYSKLHKKYYIVNVFSPKIGEFAATFADISEIKEKEKALIKMEAHLKDAQKLSKIGSWTLNFDNDEVTWTEELYKTYGLDPKTPIPPFSEHKKLFMPDSWELLSTSMEKTKKTGLPYELELRTIKSDGTNGWLWVRCEAVKDSKGKTTGLMGVAQDISKSKNLLEKVKYERQFSQKIMNSSASGVCIQNIKANITYTNKQYEKILGYTMNEVNDMDKNVFNSLFHPDDRDNLEKIRAKAISGIDHSTIEYRIKHKQGHWVWCYSVYSPFEYNENGELISYIVVFIDISEKKRNEEKLIEVAKAAESANFYKNQFLANMSHELRTPMNGIIGFADLLKKDDLTIENREEYIKIIKNSSNQLLNIINDIIDISKIEAAELKLVLKPCNINRLITRLELIYAEIKKQKGKEHIDIVAKIPEKHEELTVKTDPLRLEQVLINLINNALKFSEKGTIKFGFDIIDNSISFFVKDEGIGIPKDKIAMVFNRFEQLEQGDPGKNEGTGLGLAISKGIIDLFKGVIEVDSVVGKGTTFRFTIPCVIVGNSNEVISCNNDEDFCRILCGKTILIAEDDIINIEFYKILFSRFQVNMLYAFNGKEAVALYNKHPEIDVVLMDIRMPIMSGLEAAKFILKKDGNAKIIAQTANAMTDDADKYLSSGFVDYVSKPINKNNLLKKISNLVS